MISVILCCSVLAACGDNGTTNQETGNNSGDTAETKGADSSPADSLVGSWEYTGGSYTYIFNADGTGSYMVGETEMKFTYSATDTVLSILYDGNTSPMELNYEINGTTLNVIDSLGNDTFYNRK